MLRLWRWLIIYNLSKTKGVFLYVVQALTKQRKMFQLLHKLKASYMQVQF